MGADSPDTWDGSGDDNFDGEGIGMKPIEPGCLALAAPSVPKGTPATAVIVIGRCVDTDCYCTRCKSGAKYWVIDSEIIRKIKRHDCRDVVACACRLTRIDGGDPDEIIETDKEDEKCLSQ